MKHCYYYGFLFVILMFSCREPSIPGDVNNIIKESGNVKELLKVLGHYNQNPQDSLKRKAALFLIKNLQGRYYYQDDLLKNYMNYIKFIRHDKDHGSYIMKSLYSEYGPFVIEDVKKKYDLKEVKSGELIQNIDMAFKVWKEQPWLVKLSFDDFCEYILPFRLADEVPAYNRLEIYQKFNPLLDSIRTVKGSAIEAGIIINQSLRNPKWLYSLRTSFLPHFSASDLIKYRFGACRDMVDLAIYSMRASGIPVGRDFVPQWPYRTLGHEWNTILDSNGKSVMFLGTEDNPGTPHKPGTKKGKVFRQTFATNNQSLASIKGNDDIIPGFLNDPRIKDVTDEYVKCFDVTIPMSPSTRVRQKFRKYAYIAVFNNHEWVPIHWGYMEGDKATFRKMEGNIIYLAGFYDGETLIPASSPFILNEKGGVLFLDGKKTNENNNIAITRLFPVTPDSFDLMHLSNGKFQGSNRKDFKLATDLYTIPTKPFPFWNEILLQAKDKYRYYRFYSPTYSSMGELEFYSNGVKLQGKTFGSKSNWYQDKTFEKAFDGDEYTYFDPAGFYTDTTYLGLDAGTLKALSKIRFMAPLKEDSVVKIQNKHTYRLLCWRSNDWTEVSSQTAFGGKLNFKNLQPNTLFLLIDETAKVDQRIFTIQNGKQLWW